MTDVAPRARLDGRVVEAVLIDAGGVLVDPNWRTIISVLERHGVAADADRLAAADPYLKRELDDAELIRSSTDVTRRERWLIRLLRRAGISGDPAEIEAAADEIEALHLERGVWDNVLPGVPRTLDVLRSAGLRLSLASNAEPLMRRKLDELGLSHRFDHLAISGEVGVEKPDERFFLGALDALGTPPERAIHVGDLFEVDVVGARAAGLEAVLVDAADLYTAHDVARVRSLAELPALLGLNGR